MPILRSGAVASPQSFRSSYIHAHGRGDIATKFLTVIKLDEKNFYTVIHAPYSSQKFM